MDLTIRRLKNTAFPELYMGMIRKQKISSEDQVKILSVAIVLINQKCTILRRFGYRIVLIYGGRTGDYGPLMEVSLNAGLIPVYKAAMQECLRQDKALEDRYLLGLAEGYSRSFVRDGLYYTEQQIKLNSFFDGNSRSSLAVIAPTSYGKSELMISDIKSSPHLSYCIVVPSKALLAQTKSRIVNSAVVQFKDVITHPDMYKGIAAGKVFVLTQERLSRLMSENPNVVFDTLFVDEAHNILENEDRSQLLAGVVSIARKRNSRVAVKYLTPFLESPSCLALRYAPVDLRGFKVVEYVKSERFYLADYRGKEVEFDFYDQFIDEWIRVGGKRPATSLDFVRERALSKNIIYLNKPKDLERLAYALASQLADVDCDVIKRACAELKKSVHEQYVLIDCLKKGVAYHHGSVSEAVRFYVEGVFKNSSSLKYLVCNSTLLEGVNLPVERMFIFDLKKGRSRLSGPQFKNLIGRVNRFNDIFGGGSTKALEGLQPHVYVVGDLDYISDKARLKKFFKDVANVSASINDLVENPLLEHARVEDIDPNEFRVAIERLENLENGIVDKYEFRYAATEVGRQLFAGNILELDIFETESEIQFLVDEYRKDGVVASSVESLFECLSTLFFNFFAQGKVKGKVLRLQKKSAREFYILLLKWKLERKSFNEIIRLMVRYWLKKTKDVPGFLVYAGAWGDTTLGDGEREHWIDASKKSNKDLVNLAIVRFKEEEDFFEYVIHKYIEVLWRLKLIEADFYNLIRYGSSDSLRIELIKSGLSRGLAELVYDSYYSYIARSEDGGVYLKFGIVEAMESNGEGDMLVLEMKMNVRG